MAVRDTIKTSPVPGALIRVIGVGGGGGNAVNNMVDAGIDGVEFIVANTDAQALVHARASQVLQIGAQITRGLGAGAKPAVGRQAAEEDVEAIRAALTGADLVFITAGMGGGTGTGAAPVVASVAKEMGILTVGVVTKPFAFEGRSRANNAQDGIEALAAEVDSLVTIPNDRLMAVLGKNVSLQDAFRYADHVLLGAVQGIAELITRPGLINVDFADVRTVMQGKGLAMMGSATGRGENRARDAASRAAASPLLEDISLMGASGILVNITGGKDMSIGEFDEVGNVIRSYASDDAVVVIGTVIDPDMDGDLRVTVVATGLGQGVTVDRGAVRRDNVRTLGTAAVQAQTPVPPVRPDWASGPQTTRQGVRVGGHNTPDYAPLDIPAFLRNRKD